MSYVRQYLSGCSSLSILLKPVTCKAQYDEWTGYGDVIDAVDADAVSGATVSTSNITSVIKALFQYHADKYYK